MGNKCKCGKKAMYSRPYEGSNFCENCVAKAVEKKFKKTVRKYSMIKGGDKVLLAFSGSPGSIAAFMLMNKILGPRQDISFDAVIIDEGIKGYRDIEKLKKMCKKMKINFRVISFKQEFGKTLDQVVKNKKAEPCVYCSVGKRYILNKYARENGFTKVCTGHTLEDETETILMNYFRGDVNRAARMDYVVDLSTKKKGGSLFIPKIKPLRQIPEKEIEIFLKKNKVKPISKNCPHNSGLRPESKRLLEEMDRRHPGIRFSFLETFEKMLPAIQYKESGKRINKCKKCREPTSETVCNACKLWKS